MLSYCNLCWIGGDSVFVQVVFPFSLLSEVVHFFSWGGRIWRTLHSKNQFCIELNQKSHLNQIMNSWKKMNCEFNWFTVKNSFHWVSFFCSFIFFSFHLFFLFSFIHQNSQPEVVTSALSLFLSFSYSLIREACVRGAELRCWSSPCGFGTWSPSTAGLPSGGQWAPPQCDLATGWSGPLWEPDHPAFAQRIAAYRAALLGWPGSSGCGGWIQLPKHQLYRSVDQPGSHPASRQ